MIQKEYINPEGVYKRPHQTYTRVVKVRNASSFVFVSAMVPLDDEGKLVGLGDVKAQAVQALENLKACLAAAGCTFDDVVKLTWYATNIKRDYDAIIEVRKSYFTGNPPASSMIGIRDIGPEKIPGILVEIEAIAACD